MVGRLAPRRAIARLQDDGLDVELIQLDDATHCFDDDQASDPRTVYRADLEALMRARYVAALHRVLVEAYLAMPIAFSRS